MWLMMYVLEIVSGFDHHVRGFRCFSFNAVSKSEGYGALGDPSSSSPACYANLSVISLAKATDIYFLRTSVLSTLSVRVSTNFLYSTGTVFHFFLLYCPS